MTKLLLDEVELPGAEIFRRELYLTGVVVSASGERSMVSPTIRGVKKGNPGVFDPPLELLDTWNFLERENGEASGAAHFAVMESDRDWRWIAGVIQGVDPMIGVLVKSAIAAGGAPSLAAHRGLEHLVHRLSEARDDVLGEFSVEVRPQRQHCPWHEDKRPFTFDPPPELGTEGAPVVTLSRSIVHLREE